MTDLPPFSADNPRCAKCGHGGARTTWRPWGPYAQSGPDHEHLHRECQRCGYAWDETLAEHGDSDGGGPLDDRAVAKRCHDLYDRWFWSWGRYPKAPGPDPQRLLYELNMAVTDEPPDAAERDRTETEEKQP